MKIAFSPPFINDLVRKEIEDVLSSGWITTGPKVNALEELVCEKYRIPNAVGVNSWTSGTLLLLKWWGIGPGDEVIIPAYTYAATALTVLHAGATPIMVDVKEDFTINPDLVRKAITEKTKAIIPVDFAGLPCDYDTLNKLVNSDEIRAKFVPNSDSQKLLNRIVIIGDAAHSLGAIYKGEPVGKLTDFTVLSLHAVKNITAAEGGIICINLPQPFDNKSLYSRIRRFSLNGQTKDAFTKTKAGAWQYDIVERGMKCNLADLNAALALGQLRQYDSLLSRRQEIFARYNNFFSDQSWARLPIGSDNDRRSSFHIYPIGIRGISEGERNQIIDEISSRDVAVNVHFIPLPLLSLFKENYSIKSYPVSYGLYAQEISLPIYPQMTDEMVDRVCSVVKEAYETIVS